MMNKGMWVLIGLAIFGAVVLLVMLCVVVRHSTLFKEHVTAERKNRRKSLDEQTRFRESVLMKADEAAMDPASILDSKAALRLSGLGDVAHV